MDPEVSDKAKGFLTKKIGPLPLVAWVIIGAGTGLVIVYLRRGKSAVAASSPSVGSGATPTGGAYGGSSGAGGIGQQQGDPFATQNLADSITNLNSYLTHLPAGGAAATVGVPATPGVSAGGTYRPPKPPVGAVGGFPSFAAWAADVNSNAGRREYNTELFAQGYTQGYNTPGKIAVGAPGGAPTYEAWLPTGGKAAYTNQLAAYNK